MEVGRWKLEDGSWIWKLDLKVGSGSWIWKLDLEVGSESWIWKLEDGSWKLEDGGSYVKVEFNLFKASKHGQKCSMLLSSMSRSLVRNPTSIRGPIFAQKDSHTTKLRAKILFCIF